MIALISGGSGSGKSAFAEALAMRLDPGEKAYIATMRAWGKEGAARVERHRRLRAGKNFFTVEQPVNLMALEGADWLQADKNTTVLLECTSNLLANEIFDPEGAGREAVSAAMRGFEMLAARAGNLVIVTNEIFSDGGDYDADMRFYLSALGSVNRSLARMADAVVEVVYSIPVFHKGKAAVEAAGIAGKADI